MSTKDIIPQCKLLHIPMCFAQGIVSNSLWLLDNSAKKLQCVLLLKFSLITSSKFQSATLLKLGTH